MALNHGDRDPTLLRVYLRVIVVSPCLEFSLALGHGINGSGDAIAAMAISQSVALFSGGTMVGDRHLHQRICNLLCTFNLSSANAQ